MDWIDSMLMWFAIAFTAIAVVVFFVNITSIIIGWALMGAIVSIWILIIRSL